MASSIQKPQIDLTDKKALVAAFKKRHIELWAAFGTGPLYKDYDPDKLINFIETLIKKEKVNISTQKKDSIFDVIKQNGKNVKRTMQYVANVFLKGAGLGLREHKRSNLLKRAIRKEIKKILK